MDVEHGSHSKRHARWRDRPNAPVLWANSPSDWEVVRRERRRAVLVCPEPGCGAELVSVEDRRFTHQPRFFRFKPDTRTCGHWTSPAGGGGQMSPEHLWLQQRLTDIARDLGYSATPEHPPTHSDVFVEESRYCLEVQRWSTAFENRMRDRMRTGARVCWLIRDGLRVPMVNKALFGLPAARCRVVDRNNSDELLAPWAKPTDEILARRARVQVFATVARLRGGNDAHDLRRVDRSVRPRAEGSSTDGSAAAEFSTAPMDVDRFLAEILSGERRWFPPHRLGLAWGLWAHLTDVEVYDKLMKDQQDRERRALTPPPAIVPNDVRGVRSDIAPAEKTSTSPPAPMSAEPSVSTTSAAPERTLRPLSVSMSFATPRDARSPNAVAAPDPLSEGATVAAVAAARVARRPRSRAWWQFWRR